MNSLKIEIVFPGKIKNDFLQEGFNEYVKRIKRMVKIEIKTLESSHSQNPEICIEEESKKLIKYLGEKKFILLDVEGEEMNTAEFADLIRNGIENSHDICFVVGGTYGVSNELKKRANLRLSISPMTFTHSITLLLLVEQIYRSMKIISSQPYDH
ncbi:23S rRNA (pseudouridine(1915)-N(3))-methyltransferase RlmH [Athalassotoga saccharophila]|uniref:23S rRNA (pseudouridine(1915)-N(3))-methyltransferase RlmH n=1 Tax=Athalassotoga saccharophila TaxID=1441386 RepID=UPI001E3CF86B|nr:23S rRNA (pseudouridine(1915)-N(3))-methyltransferase RlmH [Athalassotoga saccharophila]